MKSERSPIPPTLSSEPDPYAMALAIYQIRVKQLKEYGLLRRETDITDEEELDNHFDELAREYKAVCGQLGLAWPPEPKASS